MQLPYKTDVSYKVVFEKGEFYTDVFDKIQEQVNELIKNGFSPLGGISVTRDKYGNYIVAQAMERLR